MSSDVAIPQLPLIVVASTNAGRAADKQPTSS
jgi:hypothetical protein